MRRLAYTLRKTGWYWFVRGTWTWPQTHWRKYAELQAWLEQHR